MQDFDVGTELSAMTRDNHSIGGQGCFVGLVRDMAGDKKISEMALEHYPGMTEKQLKKIEEEEIELDELNVTGGGEAYDIPKAFKKKKKTMKKDL